MINRLKDVESEIIKFTSDNYFGLAIAAFERIMKKALTYISSSKGVSRRGREAVSTC